MIRSKTMSSAHRELWTSFMTVFILMLAVSSKSIADREDQHSNTPIQGSSFRDINFRKNPQLLRMLLTSDHSKTSQSLDNEYLIITRGKRGLSGVVDKPDILINETTTNETSFEDYERAYLVNKTMQLLEQFLRYGNYLKEIKDDKFTMSYGSSATSPDPARTTMSPHVGEQTTSGNRVDRRILEKKLLELRGMSLNQLASVFHNLQHAARLGTKDPGISSLCCNVG